MAVTVDLEKCTGCSACISSCPTEALEMNEAGDKVVVDDDKCIDCGVCIDTCPTEALEL